jgi:hypothetical protein
VTWLNGYWHRLARRTAATFRWTLLEFNSKGKQHEIGWNKGCLWEFETVFDGEVEAIADILEYINRNQILGDVTIHSDAQAATARVGHRGTGRGKDCAIRVVKAVDGRLARGWTTCIEWVPGHTGFASNECADQLAREAAVDKHTG